MTEHREPSRAPRGPALEISQLRVSYGSARVLDGIDLRLDSGVVSLVGRNGMGKTTLCNTIMGLHPPDAGSIRIFGHEAVGREPNEIVGMGVGYVPQGRRVWPALSVDEHLRMLARRGHDEAGWTPERVFETFPRLAERRASGGHQLSGGEQQMLAIGRALLTNPRLLILDEPTEGLAPSIVRQIEQLLHMLAEEGEMAILLVEQNMKVALDVAERAVVMVNGAIALDTDAASLKHDRERQRQLLGVSREGGADTPATPGATETPRASTEARPMQSDDNHAALPAFTRWGHGNPLADAERPAPAPQGAAEWQPTRWTRTAAAGGTSAAQPSADTAPGKRARPSEQPPGSGATRRSSHPRDRTAAFQGDPLHAAYVAGTFDTKGRELEYLAQRIKDTGVAVRTVDLSTSDRPSFADVRPTTVADHHPEGRRAVFTGDRGSAVAAMAEAFTHFITRQRDVGGVVSAGGSGATALATPAMQALPVGVPKLMVSTVASGDVAPYVGPTDICMMYSVTDVAGLNRISRQVLANAAHAMAGMVGTPAPAATDDKPAVGMTMFGVTTPCVQAVQKALEADHDCLVFHATGTGGQSMEKLAGSGLLDGLLDISLTEVCDLHVGGVMSAGEGRLDILAERDIPYVGSVGALDMVNWHAIDTVPSAFRHRNLYKHNPQVTLMRTTREECREMGLWIGRKLSRARGPVHFLIPEGGVSMLDAPGQPFHDPDADEALFSAIEETFETSEHRRIERLPYHINDAEFAEALVSAYRRIERSGTGRRETVQP